MTELMAIFSAWARASAEPSSVRYLVSAPFSIFRAFSKFLCLISTRASLISWNRLVYSGPNSSSAMMLEGCMEAMSSRAMSPYIPGSA